MQHTTDSPIQESRKELDATPADLREASVQGGAITMAAQALRFFMQMGCTMVMARLLSPRDFGLVAMATSFTGFLATFKDMGLSTATVQSRRITHPQLSSLFWINACIGLLLAALTGAVGPLLAWFYGRPQLIAISLVLGSVFLFNGLTIQGEALLKRRMRFGTLAALDLAALGAGILVAVLSAWLGIGFWALVIFSLVPAVCLACGTTIAARWRPSLPTRRSEIRHLLRFGGRMTGFNIVNYFARNLDNVLIGKFCGAHALGLYSRAYSLLMLPVLRINAPATSVALPVLSRLQDDAEKYASYYYRGLSFLVFFSMPAVAFLFLCADQVILVVLGEQWMDSVKIFRALGPAALVGTFNVASGWAYVSLGHVRRQFHAVIVRSVFIVAAFAVGITWGALGVAVAYSAAVCLAQGPYLMVCFRNTPLNLAGLARALWRPATASITAALLLFALSRCWVLHTHVLTELLSHAAAYLILYLALWLALPGGRKILGEMLQMLRELRLRQRNRGTAS